MNRKFADENWMLAHYMILGKLGEGGFGRVDSAIHCLTGEKVAIKTMVKSKLGKDLPHVYKEIDALKNLLHQNICRLYQVVETATKIYLVLEYCEGGEMFDYIVRRNRLQEPEARHFFRQLVTAIAYAHKMGYVHRDLKPENLLIKEPLQLKVIDFGLSARSGRLLETYCGSLCYAAPEIISNKPYEGPLADIWSMGVLLYILVCGSSPFNMDDQRAVTQNITAGKYRLPEYLSEECQDLLRKMMTVDLKKRITMNKVIEHKWVQDTYSVFKPSSIYQKNVFNNDIVKEMGQYFEMSASDVIEELSQWKYDYQTATYFTLLQRHENHLPVILHRYDRKEIVNSPTFHGSLESVESRSREVGSRNQNAKAMFERNDTVFVPSPNSQHHKPIFQKENVPPPTRNPNRLPTDEFCTPRRPIQNEQKAQALSRRGGSLPRSSKAPERKAAACVVRLPDSPSPKSNGMETPTKTDSRQSRSTEKSPRMGRLFASLERRAPRVFEMITPRRMRRDASVVKVCKNYLNVSVTGSSSPEDIRNKLIEVMHSLQLIATTDGWKVTGTDQSRKTSIELEVVWVEHLQKIGVKRKRITGDAFKYKRVCEEILQMAGI
ncbi:Non-specific serine/threonine protein kinase [Aphelenchoides besseyi]|nr:Non-specific serine/threonine protein kinase [Aphelenchoides besseyi]KAI6200399.1 Non-specific serine/threonine protein kinase [Aphelenchoides besseyi]